MNSVFRSDDPTDILHRYLQLLRHPYGPVEQNAAMAALAAEDPVAMWLAVATVIPEASDPVASTERMTSLADRLWGPLSDQDRDKIRALCLATSENPYDGSAAAIALAESRESWFTVDGFFDQIEAISRNIPKLRAESDFDAWAGWRIPISQISLALGYEGRNPATPEGGATDAAMMTPYLFDGERSSELARRFQVSPIADSLLLAWVYLPSFEVYLAYGSLPDALPESVAKNSSRLAAIYQSVNEKQMGIYETQEEEMIQ